MSPKKLTKEQVEDLKTSFDMFDRDGSGKISLEELKHVMMRFGHYMTNDDLVLLIQGVDVDHDGQIDFDEFVTLMEKQGGITYDPYAELRLAFRIIDTDNSGSISVAELRNLMAKCNSHLSSDEIDAIMAELDVDGDGQLDFEEFVSLMTF